MCKLSVYKNHSSSQLQLWTPFVLPMGCLQGLSLYSVFSTSVYLLWLFFWNVVGVFVIVVPNVPPANVTGNNVTSTSIFVKWDEVPADNQNGIIVNYTVTYTEVPSGNPGTKIVIAPRRNATLARLKKYTNYSITVFASTAKGGGSRSDPIIVITDADSKYIKSSAEFFCHLNVDQRWQSSLFSRFFFSFSSAKHSQITHVRLRKAGRFSSTDCPAVSVCPIFLTHHNPAYMYYCSAFQW